MSRKKATATAADAAPAAPKPLTPEARVRPGARGTPVEVGGQVWGLADYVPRLEPVWDRLYDHNVLAGRYDQFDVNVAACRLLLVNFDLTADEAADLICRAEPAALVHAVETALFGGHENYHGYSEYVRVTLRANAIDPAVIPPEEVRPVLDYLVRVGRALPPSAFVSSLEAASVRQSFAAFIRPKPKAESKPEPEPEPEPTSPEPPPSPSHVAASHPEPE